MVVGFRRLLLVLSKSVFPPFWLLMNLNYWMFFRGTHGISQTDDALCSKSVWRWKFPSCINILNKNAVELKIDSFLEWVLSPSTHLYLTHSVESLSTFRRHRHFLISRQTVISAASSLALDESLVGDTPIPSLCGPPASGDPHSKR